MEQRVKRPELGEEQLSSPVSETRADVSVGHLLASPRGKQL